MKKKVRHAGFGGLFDYAGVRWVALDIDDGEVLAVSEKSLFERPFDTGNRADWANSSLREELNRRFLYSLHEQGARLNAIKKKTVDLTSLDGMSAYGSTEDRVTLLTVDQYRKYRDLLPDAGDRFWTVTPWTCAGNGYEGIACGVQADGTLGSEGAGFGDWGVRPVVWLDGDTLVQMVPVCGPGESVRVVSAGQPVNPEPEPQKGLEQQIIEAVARAASGQSAEIEIKIHVSAGPVRVE